MIMVYLNWFYGELVRIHISETGGGGNAHKSDHAVLLLLLLYYN